MRKTRIGKRYARALMDVAEERHAVAAVADDFQLIHQVAASSREFRVLLASPVVTPAKKKAALHALFASRVGPITLTFIDLLITKRREEVLPAIAEQFLLLRDTMMNIVTVDVTTAVELTPSQEKALMTELERYTRAQIRLRRTIRTAIKGGMILRIGDTVLDASLTRQLELLRERFLRVEAVLN